MATQPIVESKTIGEYETTITIDAFQTTTRIAALPNNTLAVATIYIYNTQDLPTNSPDTVDLVVTDWTNGNVSTFELNQFKYGKYIENYPISIITISNNYPVAVQIYVQYIVKTYNPYLSPLIQDFTQLELVPTIIAQGYTGGTNFRFYNSLSNISFSGFSIGDLFYILDQQVLGTSATSTGYVTVQWTSVYTLNIGVSALGTAEDSTSYVFNVDSTTQALPSSAAILGAIGTSTVLFVTDVLPVLEVFCSDINYAVSPNPITGETGIQSALQNSLGYAVLFGGIIFVGLFGLSRIM